MINNGITIGVIKLQSSNLTPSLPQVLTIGDRVIYRILPLGIQEYYLALGDQTKYILTSSITPGDEENSIIFLLQNVFPLNSEIIIHNTNRSKVIFKGGDGNEINGNVGWLQVLEPYEKIVLKQVELNVWESVTDTIYPEDRNNKVSYIIDDPEFKANSYLNIDGLEAYFQKTIYQDIFTLAPNGQIDEWFQFAPFTDSQVQVGKIGIGVYRFSSIHFNEKTRLECNGLLESTDAFINPIIIKGGNTISVDYSEVSGDNRITLYFFNIQGNPCDSTSNEKITITY